MAYCLTTCPTGSHWCSPAPSMPDYRPLPSSLETSPKRVKQPQQPPPSLGLHYWCTLGGGEAITRASNNVFIWAVQGRRCFSSVWRNNVILFLTPWLKEQNSKHNSGVLLLSLMLFGPCAYSYTWLIVLVLGAILPGWECSTTAWQVEEDKKAILTQVQSIFLSLLFSCL